MMITNKDPFAITTLPCCWWNWQIVTINHDITVMKWPRSVYHLITVTAKMFDTWTLGHLTTATFSAHPQHVKSSAVAKCALSTVSQSVLLDSAQLSLSKFCLSTHFYFFGGAPACHLSISSCASNNRSFISALKEQRVNCFLLWKKL